MKIIELSIKDIKPYEKNPRKNDEAVQYVMQSIKEFGFKVPIVIDKNNTIVAGHTRYKASKKLKLDKVPCVVADDLTDEQIKAFRLADNKVSEKSEWDFDLLGGELDDILNIDMDIFGFESVLDDDEPEVIEDDFVEELPTEPKSKLGEIYQLGNHRLMCGDSTDIESVERLMGGHKADLLITDPPYNVNYTGKTKDNLKIKNDKMGNDDFKKFLIDAFYASDNVMREGAVFYIWHADSEGYNFRGACSDVGWKVRQCLIWNKNAMVMGRQDYQWKHEPCLYGWKEGSAHCWEGDRKQTTILEFNKPQRNDVHPTMKPVELFDYQIKNSTKKGENVLDLFAGSGTTIIACEQNERNAFCMEFDPRYVDVIIDRWEKLTGRKAILLNKVSDNFKNLLP